MTELTTEMALQQVLRRLDALENRLRFVPVPAEGDMLIAAMQFREMRADAFPADYFTDQLWSLLLDLYLASFTSDGRTEVELEQRLRLRGDRLQHFAARLVEDGYAQFQVDDIGGRTTLALTKLGVMTMQAVFARTQGRIAELRAAA